MRFAASILALLLQSFAVAPVLAENTCPNICPQGMIWSQETGKCEPYKPVMV